MKLQRVQRVGGRATFVSIGPGLVAAASDVDPTTVAAIAVIGATTVYGLAWLTLLLFPMLAVIQIIATRVGFFTRQDLQANVTKRYGRTVRGLLWASIVGVSVITLAADLDAGAAAVGLLVGAPWHWFVIPMAATVMLFLFLPSYQQLVRVLRFVLLCLFAYGFAAILAHPKWNAVLSASVVPRFHFASDWTAGALALLGTTLTSYVYVWQTIEEAEDQSPEALLPARQRGAVLGIGFAVLIFWFILVATGATLGVHHIHITTAQDAARALRPIAGPLADALFAFGLLASTLVALPVLIGTCAYVTGAEFHWKSGLAEPIRNAPRFYAAIAGAAVLGIVIALLGLNPIRVLFAASIIGGLGTPIGLVCLLAVGSDHNVMRGNPLPGWLRRSGWSVVVTISTISVVYLVQQLVM